MFFSVLRFVDSVPYDLQPRSERQASVVVCVVDLPPVAFAVSRVRLGKLSPRKLLCVQRVKGKDPRRRRLRRRRLRPPPSFQEDGRIVPVTGGPVDWWTGGPVDWWTGGPVDQ